MGGTSSRYRGSSCCVATCGPNLTAYLPTDAVGQGLPRAPSCGRTCFNRQKISLRQVFAGQTVGIKQVADHIWLATYDLGYFDDETCRLEPIKNPFGPKVLPMSPV